MTGRRCGAFPTPDGLPEGLSGPWMRTCELQAGHGGPHQVTMEHPLRREDLLRPSYVAQGPLPPSVFSWHDPPEMARARRELAAEGVRVHIDPAPGRGQGAYVRKASDRPTMTVDAYGTTFSITRVPVTGWRARVLPRWWSVRDWTGAAVAMVAGCVEGAWWILWDVLRGPRP
jgi:hypothetical protein